MIREPASKLGASTGALAEPPAGTAAGSSTQPLTHPLAHPLATPGDKNVQAAQLLNALPHPLLSVAGDGTILDVNPAAELFFAMSRNALRRIKFQELLPFASPMVSAIEQVRQRRAPINEYRVDLGTPKIGVERFVDIHIAPLPNLRDGVVIMLQERTIADKMDRQLTHRGAARSLSAMGAMMAHEIKNPLSGIRGAAQLLETAVGDEDRALCRLICDETDRIVDLVERMEAFSDGGRPVERGAVNIHEVLEHVRRVAQAGFARRIRFVESYDPSLPHVLANRDQLVQVFLNLVKNAAEAIGEDACDGEIELTTAFRPGVRIKSPGKASPVSLPLEFCVRDNGAGVPEDLMPHLFDPFVTTKSSGTGLGLALVAKIIGDHGGVIECESHARKTVFRILMPVYSRRDGAA
ncbi:ATP-binding protein [uncultured Rhodoblastus sp.]|uniref:two-component system sensor histidine kinase NtrB n=1 Tax=uncultured Rhodoblastus sp. TaxID=543037 RepID=UPI0025EDB622|nr:ATP-binding protein [uncultured Rhodoblastus sp.]